MSNRVFIIAEAGVNHNGNINIALQMIEIAKKAGVDAIKFQSFKTEKLVSAKAPKAEYQLKTTSQEESQFEMIKKLELSIQDHITLKKHCENNGILFLSSPFDIESADFLNELGMNIFKIPSGEIINLPYLKHIGNYRKEVILSTGMSTMEDIQNALEVLISSGTKKDQITVLHCNTEYPTPLEDVNLRAMLSIKDKFGVKIGFSDHTNGIDVPIAAVALGAEVIEKHFTLSRDLEGPDHKASLEPKELEAMVNSIRNIEIAISGSGIKELSKSEKKNIMIARKSVHLIKSVKKGEIIEENNLIPMRPGDGISPMEWYSIIGKKTNKDLPNMHKLTWEDLV